MRYIAFWVLGPLFVGGVIFEVRTHDESYNTAVATGAVGVPNVGPLLASDGPSGTRYARAPLPDAH
jgi:hypothetical protein